MSFNPSNTVECTLEVLGGLVSEVSPSTAPEGVSPNVQDTEYAPGEVSARRCLRKAFASPFPNNATVVYGKSYVDPAGNIRNLYLDSNGIFYVESASTPGVYTMLFNTIAGNFCKSVTAFGREYIAISDGQHGADVPLQYDGTYIDRVTQDGPGAPPLVSSAIIPAVSMATAGAPSGLTILNIFQANNGAFIVQVTSLGALVGGETVTIAGNSVSFYNGVWQIPPGGIGPGLTFVVLTFVPTGTGTGTGGTVTGTSGFTMQRTDNYVTVNTASAHGLLVGYQALISGVAADSIGGGVSGIVIDNEDLPGIATVTTATPHGLVPGINISLTGVTAATLPSTTGIAREGDVVTVTFSAAHGLQPGVAVTTAGFAASFNGTFIIAIVPSPTTITWSQVDTDATGSGGTVALVWPIPDTTPPSYFEVISAPTPTTFQIAVSYADGTWTTGVVTYAWDGTFFVVSVPSSTSFTYQQYGPNDSTASVGTVTPNGQAAPGKRQMQVLFQTRQGYITAPSPPVTFVMNGGQYVSVSNIPIGPSNVVARILAFTGAQGAEFFYIPVPAQVNGQVVSTATQVSDNSTTSLFLDFSDNTLFAATGISIPGNNLANQFVIEGSLGFGFYGSRLLTYGQRNRVQNLLNMGFDGGYLPTSSTMPTGWIAAAGGAGGALAIGHYGEGWQVSVNGSIYQSFYEDAYGAPIGYPNTQYKVRAWIKGVGASAILTISSVSTGFTTSAVVIGTSATGSFGEATFTLKTPIATIPNDMILSLSGTGSALIDELSIIYADQPYTQGLIGSYIDNPEGFDGVSGIFGPVDDIRAVMDVAIVRTNLYILTQDPSGRLHVTSQNGVTEPVGWSVDEVAANCGALSTFCTTKSQADDASAGGGEEWFSWASGSGARIFSGDEPWKISQEIQPDWTGDTSRGFPGINFQAALTTWAVNDPVARVIYFGLPTGMAQTPNLIYPLNYENLDSAYQIAMSPPIKVGFGGKLIATDNSRKWTRWNMPMNGAALMYRQPGELSLVLFGGNGMALGSGVGFGNIYTLTNNLTRDDDYGTVVPYYVTYFFVNHGQEAALQLGAHRKMVSYMTAFAYGVGYVTISALIDGLGNAWPLSAKRQLAVAPKFDLEWPGGCATGQRIAFQFIWSLN